MELLPKKSVYVWEAGAGPEPKLADSARMAADLAAAMETLGDPIGDEFAVLQELTRETLGDLDPQQAAALRAALLDGGQQVPDSALTLFTPAPRRAVTHGQALHPIADGYQQLGILQRALHRIWPVSCCETFTQEPDRYLPGSDHRVNIFRVDLGHANPREASVTDDASLVFLLLNSLSWDL